MAKIGVVVVTYNRLDKLKIVLEKFEKQTFYPSYILVVNNNSTDNTKSFLEKWEKEISNYEKYVINTKDNLGGSGGFYTGLKEAIDLDADWIWVSDDDAYPNLDALAKVNEFLESYANIDKLAAVCGKVINKDNKISFKHRKTLKKYLYKVKEINSKVEDYKKESFNINLFSYVGTVINKQYLMKYGLTNKDMFIYYDDTEHSYRLSKFGKIICVPSVIIKHDVIDKKNEGVNWKVYYGIRNRLYFYKTIGKRFYKYEYLVLKIKLNLKKILNFKTDSINIISDALLDAKNEKLGKHNTYIPGWVYEKK